MFVPEVVFHFFLCLVFPFLCFKLPSLSFMCKHLFECFTLYLTIKVLLAAYYQKQTTFYKSYSKRIRVSCKLFFITVCYILKTINFPKAL